MAVNTEKKVMKEARPPQQISPQVWQAVEAAICIGGLGYSEAGRKFRIEPHAIMMRAKRHGWAVPSKIAKRVEALQKSVTERAVCEANRHCNDQAVEIIAQSWAERGEQHRTLTFNLAHSELIAVSKRGLAIEDWSSAEKADRMARKACGLDSEEGARISMMALLNDRVEVVVQTLPKTLD